MRLTVRTQSVDTSILNTGTVLRKNYVNVSTAKEKQQNYTMGILWVL